MPKYGLYAIIEIYSREVRIMTGTRGDAEKEAAGIVENDPTKICIVAKCVSRYLRMYGETVKMDY